MTVTVEPTIKNGKGDGSTGVRALEWDRKQEIIREEMS